jgi:hypothetical protein
VRKITLGTWSIEWIPRRLARTVITVVVNYTLYKIGQLLGLLIRTVQPESLGQLGIFCPLFRH